MAKIRAGRPIPSLLIASTQSTTLVLYLVGTYLVFHLTEGYILVPLMQKKMVHLPPALNGAGATTLVVHDPDGHALTLIETPE